MLKKVLKIIGIVLVVAVTGFIGLMAYFYFQKPSPIPEIVKVDFPEKIPLNQNVEGTIEFQDGDDDLAQLLMETLDEPATFDNNSVVDLKALGITITNHYGGLTFGRNVPETQFALERLVLVDSAGHRSEPYIFKYQVGEPTSFYNHYDKEQATERPVSRHKKIHFFILSGTETDLEADSSFASDSDATGSVSPAVAKIFEKMVLPQINGLWDQCGMAFDLGMINVVRADNLKLKSGRFLSRLFGKHNGEAAILASEETLILSGEALRALGVPKEDFGIFIFGRPIWDLEDKSNPAGVSHFHESVLISWPYIHFLNKDAGEILLPKRILITFAHELGHALGLNHPAEETTIPRSKFGIFNLMKTQSGWSELIPEQCEIVNKLN